MATVREPSRKKAAAAEHQPPGILWCSGFALWYSGFSHPSLKLYNDQMLQTEEFTFEKGKGKCPVSLVAFVHSPVHYFCQESDKSRLWLVFSYSSFTLKLQWWESLICFFFPQFCRFWKLSCHYLFCSVAYFILDSNTHFSGSSGLVRLLGAEWEHVWNLKIFPGLERWFPTQLSVAVTCLSVESPYDFVGGNV